MRTAPQSLASADRQTEVRTGKGAKSAFDEPGCSIRARRGEGVQAALPKSLIVWERRSSRDPLGSWGPCNSWGFLQDVGLTCGQRLNPFPLGAECAATLAQVLPAFLEPVQEPRTKRLTQ